MILLAGTVSLSDVSNHEATWTAITDAPIDVTAVLEWCGTPGSGAIDVFCGTVRDHAEGRTGIIRLDYEAHPTHAEPRIHLVADAARRRWPMIERLALLHRTGSLEVGETAVVVAASTAHRTEAFDATRWCIDAIKATVPIWKYEMWDGGEGWGTCGHELVDLDEWQRTRDDDTRQVPVGVS